MNITDISAVPVRPRAGWGLSRPVIDTRALEQSVAAILEEVRRDGDKAVQKFTMLFDKASTDPLELSRKDIMAGADLVADELKAAIRTAAGHIRAFHAHPTAA